MAAVPIYLDNNATTRPDPKVVEAMLPYLSDRYGNAASHAHAYGWDAIEAVDSARAAVAELIGADPREIVFTSGATESDNLALRGVWEANRAPRDAIVTTSIEHKAILDTARQLETHGARIRYIGVDGGGRVDLDELAAAIDERTVLVSVMLANNEIGTLQEIAAIGALCHARKVLLHTDATQAVGKIEVDVRALQVDLMSMSAHKMHGPKGVGALYVRRRGPRVDLVAQLTGGGHESGRRSGTLNTPGIVGFGKAAQICRELLSTGDDPSRERRDHLEDILLRVPGARVNGDRRHRLPNTLNVRFDGVEAEALIATVPGVAMATGSACASASVAPSHVLKAIGLSDAEVSWSLRLSTSRFTTAAEIECAADRIASAVAEQRRLAA
ncbi:MAG: cysteine desulfurase family protein [Capsulimonadaceae bacterium]